MARPTPSGRFLLLLVAMVMLALPGLVWSQDKTTGKKVRVMLYAGGPTREYQFVRNLFVAEQQAQRAELFLHLKGAAADNDVDADHVLKEFPDRLGVNVPGKRGANLSDFDLIIAIDPDWDALHADQIKLVDQWVSRDGGALILVAGPISTYHLGKHTSRKFQPLESMLPVLLRDSRLVAVDVNQRRPYPLHFGAAAKQADFLKLDHAGTDALAGWNRLFWGAAEKPTKKDQEPEIGFFGYYPVEKVQPAATVLATFAGPRDTRINDGKDEQPFLVTMPHGAGRTFYISSGETWRLRQFKTAYHERFWLQLARHMTSESQGKERKAPRKVLIIDGEGARSREKDAGKGDSFFIKTAIDSITERPYEAFFGDEVAGGTVAAKALERDDLAQYAVIMLLNVRDLKEKQLANLEKYATAGGGVAFFLGPKVSSDFYNDRLFKKGKGLFPVPLEDTYFPPRNQPPLKTEFPGQDMLLLRHDLFPDMKRFPIFGPIVNEATEGFLKEVPIKRYFKVPRDQWHPDPAKSFALASLPSNQPATSLQKPVLEIFYSQKFKGIIGDEAFKKYKPGLVRHRTNIAIMVAPTSMKKSLEMAEAIATMLADRGRAKERGDYPDLTGFWASKNVAVKTLRDDVTRLMYQAQFGDPLIIGGTFGKGRVVAVMTTAGREWNDWAGGSMGTIMYLPFVWESLNYLAK